MKQREIKFRVWDRKWKKMYRYPFDDGICVYGNGTFDIQRLGDDGHAIETAVSEDGDLELLQFTGLLDKKGKEIYEGDRLRYVFLEVISGGIREPEAKFITVENILRFDVMRAISDTDEVEIIGNIYEHPELLTK